MQPLRMHIVVICLILLAAGLFSATASAQETSGGADGNMAQSGAQPADAQIVAPMENDPEADPIEKDELAKEALEKAGANGDIPVGQAHGGMDDYRPGGQEITLEEAVRLALKQSPSISSSKAQALAAEDFRRSALGDFFPSLTLSYSYTRYDHERPRGAVRSQQYAQNQYQMGANVHQDIFTGFRLENTYQKAQLTKEQLTESLRDTELNLILNVQTNFLSLLMAREDVRSAQDSVTRLSSQLKVTQAFYDVGLKPKLDVLQAEVDLARAEDELLQARNSVATQQARINTLLTLPLEADVNYMGELEYTPFSLSLDECLKRAYENRPDLEVARKNVEIARKDTRIAFSDMLPQVGADLDMSRSGDTWAVDGGDGWYQPGRTGFAQWSVSVSAQWKVFDFGSSWYGWRQAQKGIYRYQADEQSLREEVAYDIKSAHLKIGETEARIKVTRKALEQAKESYRMAVARYQAQVGTNTDVLDAQSRLTEAEANLTQALGDYQTAIANLYVAMGMKNYNLLPE